MHTRTFTAGCLLFLIAAACPARACTSFCMETPEGPVFAANLDLFIPGDGLVFVNRRGIAKEGYDRSTAGETAKWVSKYGSVTFNLAGREFAFSGINEAGLVVSSMELRAGKYPKPDERPPVGNATWVQYVLDTCGSVQEVIRTDAVVRMQDVTPPTHYLVADANGDCAAIEWLDGRLVCHTGESLPVRAMSNMRYGRALEALERGGPRWWWSNPGQSAERFAAAAARMESFDARRDTSSVRYAFETLTKIVAAPHTRWNIVYDVPNREVWFRSVRSPSIKHLSLGAFDFGCDAPVRMLDVNAALEGNVEQAFTLYDHDVNLRVFRTLCERYEIEISEQAAEDLIRQFENFECVRPRVEGPFGER